MPKKTGRDANPWHMDVRILRDNHSQDRDMLGFVEAPLEEIRLLKIWCSQVLEGAYSVTDDGFATLLMDLHRPARKGGREFLIGRMKPGCGHITTAPRHISLPHEHQAFE